jgi:catechol-2,3-dioxygenase
MKRLHVHIAVKDIEESVVFYSGLFEVAPTVLKEDYAKWMLDDPRVNFAISTRGQRPGLDHLGIQAETAEELGELSARVAASAQPVLKQGQAVCCYARSEKSWVSDPQGIAWEMFLTLGESARYGDDSLATRREPQPPSGEPGACCVASPG